MPLEAFRLAAPPAPPKAKPLAWTILTGQYPPQPGGVGDYTWILAHALVEAGDDVHVVAPPCRQPDVPGSAAVHRLPDVYGPRSLTTLGRVLRRLPQPRTVLVQYVAQSFGFRGCNMPFAA